jgi:type VI secretion system protein
MVFDRSLLERIDEPEQRDRRLNADPAQLSQSIARNLTRMLNVRQGSVSTLPDYGMPDFNDLVGRFPDGLNLMRRAIRTSIERYEPRLRRVTVKHVVNEDDPLDLRFRITASMILEDRDEPVAFETLIGSSGQIKIRG